MGELNPLNPWNSFNDIGELAANVLQESIEKKHGDSVNELIDDPRAPTEHAEILSHVLGKTVIYQNISEEHLYKVMTKQGGVTHTFSYLYIYLGQYISKRIPGPSILLGRQPEMLKQWIEKNKSAFL